MTDAGRSAAAAGAGRRLGGVWLQDALRDARCRTLALLDDLSDAQWQLPQRSIINLPRWELGHIGWFMELWCLRGGDRTQPSLLPQADALYDSSAVPHAARWQLALPSRAATADYVAAVLERALDRLAAEPGDDDALYPYRLALFHEDMHGEAFVLMRQAMGYPAPSMPETPPTARRPHDRGDVQVDGGLLWQGVPAGDGFRFDNEGEPVAVQIAPFAIAARRVSNAQFAAFVDAGGYETAQWWDEAGDAWRRARGARHPVYWRRGADGWQERRFDRWLPLAADDDVRHVNAHEAEAWCRWAGRRLPTESEWELAARSGSIDPFDAVTALWEWTASPFLPYPGFVPGPYRDYSQPWFGSHRVLRGASAATPLRLRDARFRNFYTPDRSDMLCGIRSCAR